MSKTAVQPENHLLEHQGRWFGVYTRYKCEKAVVKQLKEKSIEAYVPLKQTVRRYPSKIKKVELPLITCYVFVWITKKEYLKVLQTVNVIGFVKIANNLLSIPEQEIEVLKRVAGETIPVEIQKEGYRSGDLVEIVGGQLTGLKGRLISKKSKNNFVIELEHLGIALCMEVDPRLLVKI